jgi:hypothetical protein
VTNQHSPSPNSGEASKGKAVDHRRQLDTSQRAALVLAIKPMADAAAKERQRERKGGQAGSTKANLPELSEGQSRDQIAATVGVSGRTVQDAALVPMRAVQAKERMHQGRPKEGTANLRQVPASTAAKEAANMTGVSARIVEDALYVQKHDPAAFEDAGAGKRRTRMP